MLKRDFPVSLDLNSLLSSLKSEISEEVNLVITTATLLNYEITLYNTSNKGKIIKVIRLKNERCFSITLDYDKNYLFFIKDIFERQYEFNSEFYRDIKSYGTDVDILLKEL